MDAQYAENKTAADLTADAAAYRLIVENAVDLIVRGDAARHRTYVSPSCREILGFDPAEMLGKHAYELVHPDDLQHVTATFGRVGRGVPLEIVTFRMRRKDGAYIWVEGRYRHLPEDDGILAVLRDITAQKQAEIMLADANAKLAAANAELQAMAHRDGLTGLSNRRHFDNLLDKEFHSSRQQRLPLGLVLVDVDYFKSYNDTYGHLGGDECLRVIARTIKASVRHNSDNVARYGGEELVTLLPGIDLDGAESMAERMRHAVEALGIEHRGSTFGVVTVSAGVSSGRPRLTETDPLPWVVSADKALYHAKATGRNKVCRQSLRGHNTGRHLQRGAAE